MLKFYFIDNLFFALKMEELGERLGFLSILFANDAYYQMVGVGYILFFGGLLKICFTQKNLLLLLLGIEAMMLGLIVLSLSCFLHICVLNPFNYVIVFNLLTLVISESVIGLILVLLLSKSFGSIDLFKLNKLKG